MSEVHGIVYAYRSSALCDAHIHNSSLNWTFTIKLCNLNSLTYRNFL